jgi:hypothetical protein
MPSECVHVLQGLHRYAITVGLLLTPAAFAQCQFNLIEAGELAGLDGPAAALQVWDPDGPGPAPDLLLVSGDFTRAGNLLARGVVAWDGTAWQPLGNGLAGAGSKIVIHLGYPVLIGNAPGDPRPLARFNGTNWEGLGIAGDQIISLLADSDGGLLASGSLTSGATPASFASWQGNYWQPLGPVTYPMQNLTEFAGTYVGENWGLFSFCGPSQYHDFRRYRWDGTAWQVFSTSYCTNGFPGGLTAHQGELWAAGGRFDTSFVPTGVVTLSNPPNPFRSSRLFSDGQTVFMNAGSGSFSQSTATALSTSWSPDFEIGGLVADYALFRGEVYLAGSFTHNSGIFGVVATRQPRRIARREGVHYCPLSGTDGAPTFFVRHNGQLLAGGDFSMFNSAPCRLAAIEPVGSEPFWNGDDVRLDAAADIAGALYVAATSHIGVQASMFRLQNGVATPMPLPGRVLAMTEYNGLPCAGGDNVSLWSGNAWERLNPSDVGFLEARDLEVFNGQLFTAGRSPCYRYDGITWTSTGARSGTVYALELFGTELIAGGDFSIGDPSLPSVPVKLGRWNGNAWVRFAGDSNGLVRAMCERGGEFIVGGSFTSVGGSDGVPPVASPYLAAWNGSSWRALANVNGQVWSIASEGEDILIGGLFTAVNGQPAHNFARLRLRGCCGSSDFNADGDFGTDQDIEAFFACLAGHCCPTCGSADFNADDDFGTDQDIEAFFRVLAGGTC